MVVPTRAHLALGYTDMRKGLGGLASLGGSFSAASCLPLHRNLFRRQALPSNWAATVDILAMRCTAD